MSAFPSFIPTGPLLGLVVALSACRGGGTPPAGQARTERQDDVAADQAMAESRWETAVRLHRQLLERDPESGLTLYHLGFSEGSLGRRREEIELYERAIQAGYDSPDLLYNLGLAKLDQGDLGGAEEALAEALEARPDEAEFHYAAARVALARQGAVDGERHLVRATELDPGHREAWAALADLYEREGRDQDAALARARAR